MCSNNGQCIFTRAIIINNHGYHGNFRSVLKWKDLLIILIQEFKVLYGLLIDTLVFLNPIPFDIFRFRVQTLHQIKAKWQGVPNLHPLEGNRVNLFDCWYASVVCGQSIIPFRNIPTIPVTNSVNKAASGIMMQLELVQFLCNLIAVWAKLMLT